MAHAKKLRKDSVNLNIIFSPGKLKTSNVYHPKRALPNVFCSARSASMHIQIATQQEIQRELNFPCSLAISNMQNIDITTQQN